MKDNDVMKFAMLAVGLVSGFAIILMMNAIQPSISWTEITGHLAGMSGALILFFAALMALVYILGRKRH